ncbi:MAG: hypothetical protein ACI9EW_002564 [Cellvibrionaceae bacterium]|jgi:hypothetical protein
MTQNTPDPDLNKETKDEPFRFFDNREKYLLFVTTTSEKSVVARRIGRELDRIQPKPPALRLFDAGTGNGAILSNVMRQMHCKFPTVPFYVVGKEISMEDTRLTLSEMADRFAEHPQTVVVLTNMFYAEAPWLYPASAKNQAKLKWWNVPLKGHSAHEFGEQIEDLDHILTEGWQTVSSKKTGNPSYRNPSVIVLYREDHEFVLNDIIPKNNGEQQQADYDFALAAQPYRSRQTAEFKGKKVLAPLARSLGVDGRMVVVQSTGHDPGMEIIRKIWPLEEPFATPRHLLINELRRQLNREDGEQPDDPAFIFDGHSDDRALFTYHLHSMPNEVSSNISTSTMLAAWNAAVYVAQIEDDRIHEQLQTARYLDATAEVVRKHGGLWFQDESFVVVRKK